MTPNNLRFGLLYAFGLVLAALALIGLIYLWVKPASAQDGWLPGSRCEWKHGKERCARRHTSGLVEWHFTDRVRQRTLHYRRVEEPNCPYEAVTAIGEERYGNDRAKEAAAAAWMERVRFRHGVRFMDLRNARHASYECSRSSTGNRASEKTAEIANRFLEQCELKAEPCKAQKDSEEK